MDLESLSYLTSISLDSIQPPRARACDLIGWLRSPSKGNSCGLGSTDSFLACGFRPCIP